MRESTWIQNLLKWASGVASSTAASAMSLAKAASEDLAALPLRFFTSGFAGFGAFLAAVPELPPASLKKAMVFCSCADWLLISKAVAASCSELAAFCWVVWLI